MRSLARWLLLLFSFTIPWEYSLDLGAPWGNIARITGLLLSFVAGLAVLRSGRMRKPGPLQWLALALCLWFCCSYYWSVAPYISAMKLRGYLQEMMLIWLVWELMESQNDLRNLVRAWLAGSWVLALATIAAFLMRDPGSEEQIRFVATGQDPNDVARFLSLGIPVAAFLLLGHERRPLRFLAVGYIPLAFASVLLTGSRSGTLVAAIALTGCVAILWRRNPGALISASLMLPALSATVWLVVPHETLLRLGTILEQLRNADLNQRVSIWAAGWHAFLNAPLLGHGAGTFVIAARLATEDTAHNTVLSILVEGGLIALGLAGAIFAFTLKATAATTGALRRTLLSLMIVWLVASLAGSLGENRITWLLLGLVGLAGRLAEESPQDMESVFADPLISPPIEPASETP
jgi:O-antigen ligase